MTAEGIRQQSAEQVFKVISQKAASPPHAVGSEFQTFSPSGANAHPSGTPQSASAPYRCCPCQFALSIDRRTSPGMSWSGPFSPSKLRL